MTKDWKPYIERILVGRSIVAINQSTQTLVTSDGDYARFHFLALYGGGWGRLTFGEGFEHSEEVTITGLRVVPRVKDPLSLEGRVTLALIADGAANGKRTWARLASSDGPYLLSDDQLVNPPWPHEITIESAQSILNDAAKMAGRS